MITPEDMAATHADAFLRSRAWSIDEFTSLLSHPSVFALGDKRAFVLARVIADEAELLTIGTRQEAQRQGLARRLMDDWHREAQRRGATYAFLEVAADNAPARELYTACGYSETGRRRAYYARDDKPPADAVIMARALTQG